MKRYLLILSLFLPLLAAAQTGIRVPFATARTTDTAYTRGSVIIDSGIKLPAFAVPDSTHLLSVDAKGNMVLRQVAPLTLQVVLPAADSLYTKVGYNTPTHVLHMGTTNGFPTDFGYNSNTVFQINQNGIAITTGQNLYNANSLTFGTITFPDSGVTVSFSDTGRKKPAFNINQIYKGDVMRCWKNNRMCAELDSMGIFHANSVIAVVVNINALERYNGLESFVFVADSVNGGLFAWQPLGTANYSTTFPALIKGGLYVRATEALMPKKTDLSHICVDGNFNSVPVADGDTTPHHYGEGSLFYSPDNTTLYDIRPSARIGHTPDDDKIVMRTSADDGHTWSAYTTIYDSLNCDDRNMVAGFIGNRLVVWLRHYYYDIASNTGTVINSGYISSTDGGSTWSSFTAYTFPGLNTTKYGTGIPFGKIVQNRDSAYITFYYAGTDSTYAMVLATQRNDGLNYNYSFMLYGNIIAANNFEEPYLESVGQDSFFVAIRNQANIQAPFELMFSPDWGHTITDLGATNLSRSTPGQIGTHLTWDSVHHWLWSVTGKRNKTMGLGDSMYVQIGYVPQLLSNPASFSLVSVLPSLYNNFTLYGYSQFIMNPQFTGGTGIYVERTTYGSLASATLSPSTIETSFPAQYFVYIDSSTSNVCPTNLMNAKPVKNEYTGNYEERPDYGTGWQTVQGATTVQLRGNGGVEIKTPNNGLDAFTVYDDSRQVKFKILSKGGFQVGDTLRRMYWGKDTSAASTYSVGVNKGFLSTYHGGTPLTPTDWGTSGAVLQSNGAGMSWSTATTIPFAWTFQQTLTSNGAFNENGAATFTANMMQQAATPMYKQIETTTGGARSWQSVWEFNHATPRVNLRADYSTGGYPLVCITRSTIPFVAFDPTGYRMNIGQYDTTFATGITLGVAGALGAQHIAGNTGAPTIAAGAAAGTSPTITVTGTDMAGKITITTGTATTTGTLATLTFNTTYGTVPYPAITPGNSATAALSGATAPSYSTTASTLVLSSGSSALAASTTYVFYYHIIQ